MLLKTLNTIDRGNDIHVTKSQDTVEMSEELQNAYNLFTRPPRQLDFFEKGEKENIEESPEEFTEDNQFNNL